MDRERFKSVVLSLKRYKLTEGEKRFVELIEEFFNRNGNLNEEQKSLLGGIYREKKKWGEIVDLPEKGPVNKSTLP